MRKKDEEVVKGSVRIYLTEVKYLSVWVGVVEPAGGVFELLNPGERFNMDAFLSLILSRANISVFDHNFSWYNIISIIIFVENDSVISIIEMC